MILELVLILQYVFTIVLCCSTTSNLVNILSQLHSLNLPHSLKFASCLTFTISSLYISTNRKGTHFFEKDKRISLIKEITKSCSHEEAEQHLDETKSQQHKKLKSSQFFIHKLNFEGNLPNVI